MTNNRSTAKWAGAAFLIGALCALAGARSVSAQGTQPDFPPFGLDIPWTLANGAALVKPGDAIDKTIPPEPKWYLMSVGRIWQGQVRARWSSGFNGGYSWPGGQTQGTMSPDPNNIDAQREHWGGYQTVHGGITGCRNWDATIRTSPSNAADTTVLYPYFTCENVRYGWDIETKFTGDFTAAKGAGQPTCVTGYTDLESAMVMRWLPPQVIVNGVVLIPYTDTYGAPGSGPAGNGIANFASARTKRGVIDPNLRSEQVIFHGWRTPQGVDIFRNIHQYGSYPDNNYILEDLYFVNTGNLDPSAKIERPNKPVQDFRVILAHQIYASHMTASFNNKKDDDYIEYLNQWPTYLDGSGRHRQVVISYDGDGTQVAGPDWGDPWGQASGGKQVIGNNLWGRGYFGYTFVFAETGAGTGVDDPSEPRGNTMYAENDLRIERNFLLWDHGKQFRLGWTGKDDPNDLASARRMYDAAHPTVGTDIVEDTPITGTTGMTVHTGTEAGDLPPYYDASKNKTGQGVYHAVFGVAAAGLDDRMARTIANRVMGRDVAGVTPRMTPDEINLVKSGRDSLKNALDRMFWNVQGFDPNGSIPAKPSAYNQAFNVPDAPRPPGCLWVTSLNRKIELQWTNDVDKPDFDTGVNDLAGFRVYRALASPDSDWTLVKQLPKTATSWTDTDVIADFTYFYYVTAFDDGSANWLEQGKSIESGPFWSWTGWGYYPNVDAGTGASRPSDFGRATTDSIVVVPNPYNTNLKFPAGFIGAVDKIYFKNLPAPCTIRIYTTAGVLVKTLENTLPASNARSGSVGWNMANDYNQLVASGVYIFTVESTAGTQVGKFIIIR